MRRKDEKKKGVKGKNDNDAMRNLNSWLGKCWACHTLANCMSYIVIRQLSAWVQVLKAELPGIQMKCYILLPFVIDCTFVRADSKTRWYSALSCFALLLRCTILIYKSSTQYKNVHHTIKHVGIYTDSLPLLFEHIFSSGWTVDT